MELNQKVINFMKVEIGGSVTKTLEIINHADAEATFQVRKGKHRNEGRLAEGDE